MNDPKDYSFELSEILKAMKSGGIWSTPAVSDQPMVTLVRWSVRETERGERHFLGYNFEDREGRVSTAIQSYDRERCQGVTKSGRIYRLIGPARFDSDADYVWNHWGYAQGVKWKDVSSEYRGAAPEKPDVPGEQEE
ncbi:hypothetical protein [Geomonas edaphica]|uniref:hypothetical protein n=1 Tax=Geomonas edaphica TaxID=2570226 RepID=UPI0018E09D5C|nr:hypothetical protein [Geomonas edaphica]